MLRGRPSAIAAEQWRSVVGYETSYEVSNYGNVRSLSRIIKDARTGRRRLSGRSVTKIRMANGYLAVGLCRRGQVKLVKVHRLVLEAFVGPCPKGFVTRHFPDPNKENNRLDNLSWASSSRNALDRRVQGTDNYQHGEDSHRSKLTERGVRKIRKLYATGNYSQSDLANWFGVSQPGISVVLSKKTWKHVS